MTLKENKTKSYIYFVIQKMTLKDGEGGIYMPQNCERIPLPLPEFIYLFK